MVKFRTSGGEADGKGFGLLAIEPTFDRDLPLSMSSLWGPNLRLHGADWPANKSPRPVASYRNYWRREEKSLGSTSDWLANQIYGLVLRILGRGKSFTPLFFDCEDEISVLFLTFLVITRIQREPRFHLITESPHNSYTSCQTIDHAHLTYVS